MFKDLLIFRDSIHNLQYFCSCQVRKVLREIMQAVLSSVSLDLVRYRLITKLQWSEERADKAIPEYLRFLHLLSMSKKGISLAPSIEVDEVWHAHILHTALYAKHCQEIAGRFIHHSPSAPTEEKSKGRQSYATTLEKYVETFHHDPPADVWPTLSDVDAAEDAGCGNCSSIRCRSQCPSCNASCDDDAIAME